MMIWIHPQTALTVLAAITMVNMFLSMALHKPPDGLNLGYIAYTLNLGVLTLLQLISGSVATVILGLAVIGLGGVPEAKKLSKVMQPLSTFILVIRTFDALLCAVLAFALAFNLHLSIGGIAAIIFASMNTAIIIKATWNWKPGNENKNLMRGFAAYRVTKILQHMLQIIFIISVTFQVY